MKACTAQPNALRSPGSFRAQGSCWEPVHDNSPEPVGDEFENVRLTWTRVELEDEIIAVFDAPRIDAEQVELTFRRKEQQLAAIFARLVPAESLALQRRLTLAIPGDPIAQRFGGLVPARRTRLLTFLAEARRRHPLQVARMEGCRG
jgi:hypothetical protein